MLPQRRGMLSITRTLNAEAMQHGVRVFAINPDMVRTALSESTLEAAIWTDVQTKQRRETQWVSAERAAGVCLAIALGQADVVAGRYIDTVDSPTLWCWRALGMLGSLWRDGYAMYVVRKAMKST
jgi:NAD(P)-dependent dehydrogenase (short-subunit alcohol dehydrogenase family)